MRHWHSAQARCPFCLHLPCHLVDSSFTSSADASFVSVLHWATESIKHHFNMSFTVEERGNPNSLSYRLFFSKYKVSRNVFNVILCCFRDSLQSAQAGRPPTCRLFMYSYWFTNKIMPQITTMCTHIYFVYVVMTRFELLQSHQPVILVLLGTLVTTISEIGLLVHYRATSMFMPEAGNSYKEVLWRTTPSHMIRQMNHKLRYLDGLLGFSSIVMFHNV